MGGGGGLLQSIIGAGMGGAGAGGVRGGGLSSDIVPSASPGWPSASPPPLPPPRSPLPSQLDAGTAPPAGLNYGMATPQMNAIQLATGSSVIDPFTGSPVPAPSATGNAQPSGPTPLGVAAAAGQMAQAPAQMAAVPATLAGASGGDLVGSAGTDVFDEIAAKKPKARGGLLGPVPPGGSDSDLPGPPPGPPVPMIQRPPAVPIPGIDTLLPPPREDIPAPSREPSPLWQGFQRDQNLDALAPPGVTNAPELFPDPGVTISPGEMPGWNRYDPQRPQRADVEKRVRLAFDDSAIKSDAPIPGAATGAQSVAEEKTIGQRVQEYFNPLTSTIDTIIKTPLTAPTLPDAATPGAGTGNRQTGGATQPTTSLAQRAIESAPTLPSLPQLPTAADATVQAPSPFGGEASLRREYLAPTVEPYKSGDPLPFNLGVSEALRTMPGASGGGSAAQKTWDWLTGVPEREGPPMPPALPPAVAASGGTPGAAEVRYGLPGEGQRPGQPPISPTTTIHIDPDGTITYGTKANPLGQPAPLPPAATQAPAQPQVVPPTAATTPAAVTPVTEPTATRVPARPGVYQETGRPQGPVQPIQGFSAEQTAQLEGTDERLQRVIRRAAQDNPNMFTLGDRTRTVRTPQDQQEMIDRGWSNARTSLHQAGNAVDLVPINPKTMQPDYDYTTGYADVNRAMQDAAQKEGLAGLVEWGGGWKNPDRPHFEVQGGARGPQGPTDIVTSRSDDSLKRFVDFTYGRETGGEADPNTARNRAGSSAVGKGQFIESTWLETVDAAMPHMAGRLSRDEKLALRSDPQWMDSMMLYHTKYNVGKLEEAGLPATDANLYATHRLGATAATNVLKNPDRPIADFVSPAALRMNPDLRQTGRSWMGGVNTRLEGTGASAGQTTVASDPRVQGTEVAELRAASPTSRETTPGGRVLPNIQPQKAAEPPERIPDAKKDIRKYEEAVRGLTPAQVVRQTDKDRMFGRLAGLFGGMAGGKSWGDMFMGGATGGLRARVAEGAQDRADANLTNERDFSYRQRLATLEGEIAGVNQQNQQTDVSAANTNAERKYEVQKFNTAQEVATENERERLRAGALNEERQEQRPKPTVTEKGITITKTNPDGSTDIQHTPLPQIGKDYERVKEASELLKKSDFASQDAGYQYLGEKYGSDGIKVQMLGDLAQNSRYVQVLGGNKQLLTHLKKIADEANKMLPPAAQTDQKQVAIVQEEAVKNELIKLWQGGQLGEGWVEELKKQGHPGALRLQPSAGSRRQAEPSGASQGAAYQ